MRTPQLSILTHEIDGTAMVRCFMPYNYMHRQGRLTLLSRWQSFAADAVLFQRHYEDDTLRVMQALRRQGVKVLVDIDDDVLNVDRANPAWPSYQKPEIRRGILDVLGEADALFVSTDPLRKAYRQYARQVFVIPNGLDYENVWKLQHPPATAGGPVVIGYAGSLSHVGELDFLRGFFSALKSRFGADVHFRFLGYRPAWLKDEIDEFEFQDWTDVLQYPGALQSAGIHIALAPIADHLFNRSKSNLKWLEYSAAGACVVASDVGPYSTLPKNAVQLARNKKNDWVKVVGNLVTDQARRQALATAAQARIVADYSLDRTIDAVSQAFDALGVGKGDRRPFSISFDPQPDPDGVDVIIPVYNTLEHVQKSVTAFQRELGPKDMLFVIDD